MSAAPDIDPLILRPLDPGDGALTDGVYASLKSAIMSLALPPGAFLRKGAICERLGVSRWPVSEAIAKLAAEGLVEVLPQSGSRVSRFSLAALREAMFLREAIETAAVARVAERRAGADVATLRDILSRQAAMIGARDFDGFYRADEAFHDQLMRNTGFAGVVAAAAQVSAPVRRARILLLPTPGRLAETLAEHQAILDAVAAGDPAGARRAMAEHLSQLIPRLEPLAQQRAEYFNDR